MPVLAKFRGIVIRMLVDRTFGTHLHAFYGDSEMVVNLDPLHILESEVPPWVEAWVMNWIDNNYWELQKMKSPCLVHP